MTKRKLFKYDFKRIRRIFTDDIAKQWCIDYESGAFRDVKNYDDLPKVAKLYVEYCKLHGFYKTDSHTTTSYSVYQTYFY